MEFVSLKSLSMMLPSSPNSVQSFDSAEVINIHELVELIGRLSCIITGDWSEKLGLGWTRAGDAAGPRESRLHAPGPGLLCSRARGAGRTMGCGTRAETSRARGCGLPPPSRAPRPRNQPAAPCRRPPPCCPHPSPAPNAWDPGPLLLAVTQSGAERRSRVRPRSLGGGVAHRATTQAARGQWSSRAPRA